MSFNRLAEVAKIVGAPQVAQKPPKVDKKAETARIKEKEEEEERGPRAGTGGPGKAAPARFKEEDKAQVKRRRIRLGEPDGQKTAGTETKAKPEIAAQKPVQKPKLANAMPPEIGRKIALENLNHQGKLAQTRMLHAQRLRQNQDPNNSLSPRGGQQRMLTGLIAYQRHDFMQHTGGKDATYNRAATSKILVALQGLKNGAPRQTTGTNSGSTTTLASASPAAFRAKSKEASKMLAMFMGDTPPPPGYERLELSA